MFILVTGDPFKGMKIHGPFNTVKEANAYGDLYFADCECWSVGDLLPLKKESDV